MPMDPGTSDGIARLQDQIAALTAQLNGLTVVGAAGSGSNMFIPGGGPSASSGAGGGETPDHSTVVITCLSGGSLVDFTVWCDPSP